MTRLAMTALVVPDYDEAIAFCTQALDLSLIEDTDMGGGKRWVVVGGDSGGRLLLARATSEEAQAVVGRQTGGRVGWFLHTRDFDTAHERMALAGVEFLEAPRRETYGKVAVFSDPWGNRWDLIEEGAAA